MLPFLRILIGLGLVGGVVWAGLAGLAPIWILALAGTFTVCFGLGRWRAWGHARNTGTVPKALAAQAGTYLAQCAVVGLFYLVGRGLASVTQPMALPLDTVSAYWVFTIGGVALGVLIAILEARGPGDPYQQAATKIDAARAEAVLAEAAQPAEPQFSRPSPPLIAVTEETFFREPNHTHLVFEKNPDTGANDVVGLDGTKAFLSDAQIVEHETRLGITLPPRLRRLYRRQNGGSCMMIVVETDLDRPWVFDGRLSPFSGYDDLLPMEQIWTVHDSVETYADPDHQPEDFPNGAKRMIILAQWYRNTLFLDYRDREMPRVGFV
ncbi:MAG: SMI1/KNR4 family protein, partial [Pseudomonadota bacterium]